MEQLFNVGDKCFYYDVEKRSLLPVTVSSIHKETYTWNEGESIKSLGYGLQGDSIFHCGVKQYLLFKSREQFIAEIGYPHPPFEEKSPEYTRDIVLNKIDELENSFSGVFSYLNKLENMSFNGWNKIGKMGYLAAVKSIKDELRSKFK